MNEIAFKLSSDSHRFWCKTVAMLFHQFGLFGLVSYQGEPIFLGVYARDPDYPPAVNCNEKRA